jgi:hypothetical protein
MFLALAPLLVLGLWQPNALWALFTSIAHALGSAP